MHKVLPEHDTILSSKSESEIDHSSSSCTKSSSIGYSISRKNSTRSVTFIDLIDESFVVGNLNEEGISGRRKQKSQTTKRRRQRNSILDMIDRIDSVTLLKNGNIDSCSHVMTTRSYPRGVYVVSPNKRETATAVAVVSAEAFNQW